MTTGNETDPRDDTLAKAWRAQSQDAPPSALDATILAAAHRAVGSGPRAAGSQAAEATRPQRWWMPLAAAATIGVVVIGILQIAPQAPVDVIVGERADVTGRVAPASPVAPAQEAPRAKAATPKNEEAQPIADARKQVAAPASTPVPSSAAPSSPAPSASPPAAPEPFPADKPSRKSDEAAAQRQGERKDAGVEPRAMARSEARTTTSSDVKARVDAASPPAEAMAPPAPATTPAPLAAPAPMAAPAPPRMAAPAPPMVAAMPLKKEADAAASASPGAAGSAAKVASRARDIDDARREALAQNVPAAASAERAQSPTSPAEFQERARDPDAWVARIRKLRADGRVAEAVDELREFRRYVVDADARLPTDLRQWVPNP